MSSSPVQSSIVSKLTSNEAATLVVACAFAYGFIFGDTKTHERVNLTDLVKTPFRSSFSRSSNGFLYSMGATLITGLSPHCIPLLGMAIGSSSLYYALRTPEEPSNDE